MEHQEHSYELHHKAHRVGKRMDIIDKAHKADEREAKQEPAVFKAEKRGKKPSSDQEYDTSATKSNRCMRRTLVGLVDDIEPAGHTEICQFEQN